jgi:hypothetical protein
MSWDLLAFRAPQEFKSTRSEDFPPGWEPEPFGERSEVQAKLTELLPGIRFREVQETLWGFWPGGTCRLEINLGKTEKMTYLWFAVRGDAEQAFPALAQILDSLALRGVDLQSGDFFDSAASRRSAAEWRAAVERFRESHLKPRP